MKYTAEIQHSAETFRRLAKVQHDEYGIALKLFMIVIGTICLMFGISSGVDNVFSILLLFTGGLSFSSLNLPAQRNAEKLISLADGNFPHTKYTFLEKELQITSDESVSSLEYTKIYDLLEDNDFFFLFLNNSAGYMIPKKSISPSNLDKFASSLEERVGLKRHRATGLLTLNVRARLQRRKARIQRAQKQDT